MGVSVTDSRQDLWASPSALVSSGPGAALQSLAAETLA